MNAVDVFCGAGGMTRGLINSGIEVLFGLDNNPACRETYERNNHIPYLCKDITKVQPNELIDFNPLVADEDELLLVGCAPCQPFSNQRRSDHEHIAVNLLLEFGRLVVGLNPAHILIENVPGLRNRGQAVYSPFLQILNDHGYRYSVDVLNAKNFGVPQNRRRLTVMASRMFQPVKPVSTHGPGQLPFATVWDAIHGFPPIGAGEADPDIPNHRAARLQPINLTRISLTPHNGGGRRDWPENLKLVCHSGELKGYTDVYGRMSWDDVAPTLTSKCFSLSNGRFGHPEQDRAISFREAAALQTFPEDYVFFGGQQEIGKQIGNAVPVLLAQALGNAIQQQQH